MNRRRRSWIILWGIVVSAMAAAQTVGSLETAETRLRFEAGLTAPKVSSLQSGMVIWNNRAVETLVSRAEIESQSAPLHWKFNFGASHTDKNKIRFVYDAASPNLRLTWEWEVRSGHGPIEHQIRIENRDSREVWLPLQDSFVFDWQTPALDKLEQFYVEKGADTPSAAGTHTVAVSGGYSWEGMSST